ncbi:MAG: DUF5668 domain-containing protein [Anaerolineae bacterium]|nr:DUF5668 domain-containing protein [Anaerolineae bacterium]
MSDLGGSRDHRPSLFWPLVLIGAGVLLLLSNLGYLRWESWNMLWRLWPLLLIALGIDVLIGRRSVLGAFISGLVILGLIVAALVIVFLAQHSALVGLTLPSGIRTEHIEHPRGEITSARVEIDWSSLPGYLSALRDSPNLIEGDIAYWGNLIFNVNVSGKEAHVELDSYSGAGWEGPPFGESKSERRWDVRLNPDVELNLALDTGSGPCEFDLSGLKITSVSLDAGSGPVTLILPATGNFSVLVEGGSGPLEIVLNEGMEARVALEAGSGPFTPDRRFRLVSGARDDDGVWETEHFATTRHRVDMIIDQGSGPIRIVSTR